MGELFSGAVVSLAVSEAFQKVKAKINSLLPQQRLNTALFDILDTVTQELCQSYNLKIFSEKLEEALHFISPFTFAWLNDEYKVKSFLSIIFQKEPTLEHINSWKTRAKEEIARNNELYNYLDTARESPDRIQKVIWKYIDGFTKPLFLHEDRNPLVNLTNLYIEPRVIYNGETSRNFQTIFSSFLDDKKGRLLFVEGSAAVGKTTLVAWLCHQYLFGNRELFQNRPLVCVRLRELTMRDKEELENFFSYLGCSEDEFCHRYPKAVIVMDGADELAMIEGKSVENFFLELQSTFPDCKWIITGREQYVVKRILQSKLKEKWKYMHLLPFDKEMKTEWVTAYCEKCGETLSSDTIEFMKEEKEDSSMDTPLVLYLLTQTEDGEEEELRKNPWYLYHEIFSSALYQTPYNNHLAHNRRKVEHPASEYAKDMYHFLGQIAFQMAKDQNHDEYIDKRQLEDISKESKTPDIIKELVKKHPEQEEWLKSLCAVCAYWKEKGEGALEFYHNNIRDFFFCEYIYERMQACLQLENEEEPIHAEKFIETVAELFPHRLLASKKREKSTWEQTFSFLLYRLRWEYQKKEKNSLCSIEITEEKNPFPAVLYQLANSHRLLDGKCLIPSLKQIKNVYGNVLFLSRVWQEVYREDGKLKYVKIWNKEDERSVWEDVFSSFPWVFSLFVQDGKNLFSIAEKTDLSEVKLKKADLRGSYFRGTCLKWAKFGGADLSEADLSEADLGFADLKRTDLKDTNLKKTDLKMAELDISFKKSKNLKYSCNLEEAYLPPKCRVKKIHLSFS